MIYPHLAGRLFNTPLLVDRPKLDTLLAVLKPKLEGEPVNFGGTPSRSGYDVTSDGIAIIPVIGTLVRRTGGLDALCGLTSYGLISSQLQEALADSGIRAILLDIDSPGGEAGGVFDLADEIFAARSLKPIWAVANEEAFSAAYAIGAAAQRIYLSRTAGVGSVGVIAVHLDQSQAEADAGLVYSAIYAGARKNDLTPHEPLSDPARAALQAEVDRIYDLFVNSVATMRRLSADSVQATEAGVFMSEDAISAGLADQLGTFDDALADLRQSLIAPSTQTRFLTTQRRMKRMNRQDDTLDPDADPVDPRDDTLIDPADIDEDDAPPPTIEALREQAGLEARAYVAEVTELCILAGMPDRAADMIARSVPVAEARKALLEAKAVSAEATAIVGQIPAPKVERGRTRIDTSAIYAKRNAATNRKGE